ncbi:MAG: M23 family metallopeptidase [Clostridia bacterium]|nr:M23 family metallopeptidase [Clostridia bacterium]
MLERAKLWGCRAKKWMMDYAYLVMIGAVITVMAASAVYTQQIRAEQEEEIAAAAQAPETKQAQTVGPVVSPLPTIAPLQVHYTSLEDGRRRNTWPVTGEIIRPFDDKESVYWEALESFRVHCGLDIAGAAGENVYCASDGVIAEVSHDALWGWKVAVDQTDGRKAVYAGMRTVTVSQKMAVSRGEAIGILADRIACEAEMGPHLHMELYRNGRAQDPEGMLPEK